MEVRQFIRPDVAASAIAHLSVLGLVIFFTEVHPFASVTAEPITVDIVTADQLKQAETKPDKPDKPETKPDLDLSRPTPFPNTDSLTKEDTKAAFEKPPAAPDAAKASPTPPQKEQKKETRQAALPPKPQPEQQQQPQQQPPQQSQQQQPLPQQSQQPQPPQQPQPQPQPQAAQQQPQTPPPPAQSASLGYVPPEPDVTVKYHVFLGLPPDLSAAPPPPPSAPSSSGDKPGDGIDASASEKANIASNAIAEFRRHLKTCSKLPAALTQSDNVHVKLRVMMRPDGKLAAEPILIEGTASMKGLELKQGAVQALMACQPYAMLPADRYGEWKVLDLSFTPNDFTS
jgi:hypothetical protein